MQVSTEAECRTLPPKAATRQETYSLASLSEEVDEDRSTDTKYAPFENMLSAANLVTSLLVVHQLESAKQGRSVGDPELCYAILGGFSMQLRGGRQSTRDIDLVTSVKMKGVWEALTGESRYVFSLPRVIGSICSAADMLILHSIVLPDSRLVEGVLKTFVKTGSPWDKCTTQHRIEVDFKQAGFRGAPRKIAENADRIGPFDFFGQPLHFNVLNIPSMMRIKVQCCLTRAEQRDFDDVRWMTLSDPATVRATVLDGIVTEDDMVEVLENPKLGAVSERQLLMQLLESDVRNG